MTHAPVPPKLVIRRVLGFPRDRVFSAWTDPDELVRWFSPGPMTTLEARADVRVGGEFRIAMRDEEHGVTHVATGRYRTIQPPGLLVFSWRWESDQPGEESLVTVALNDQSGNTELVLTHELLPSDTSRERHQEGWTACLDNLSQYLARVFLSDRK